MADAEKLKLPQLPEGEGIFPEGATALITEHIGQEVRAIPLFPRPEIKPAGEVA